MTWLCDAQWHFEWHRDTAQQFTFPFPFQVWASEDSDHWPDGQQCAGHCKGLCNRLLRVLDGELVWHQYNSCNHGHQYGPPNDTRTCSHASCRCFTNPMIYNLWPTINCIWKINNRLICSWNSLRQPLAHAYSQQPSYCAPNGSPPRIVCWAARFAYFTIR